MDFQIRKACREDYPEISVLAEQLHRLHVEHRPDVYAANDRPLAEENFTKMLEDADTTVFAAESTGLLSAYGVMRICETAPYPVLVSQKYAYIDDFCVLAGMRKTGIGSALFERMADYAREWGASSLRLTVWEFNRDAVRFYEKMGMSTRNRSMEMNLRLPESEK